MKSERRGRGVKPLRGRSTVQKFNVGRKTWTRNSISSMRSSRFNPPIQIQPLQTFNESKKSFSGTMPDVVWLFYLTFCHNSPGFPQRRRPRKFNDRQISELHRLTSSPLANVQHLDRNDALVFGVIDDNAVHLDRIVDRNSGEELDIQHIVLSIVFYLHGASFFQ
jgi:hypothetical protein